MATNNQRQIASNIGALNGLAGWNQTALARATGITEATISRKMRGLADWSLHDLERIATALSVTLPELVGRIPDASEWDRRRNPHVVSGPRFLVMPDDIYDGVTPGHNRFELSIIGTESALRRTYCSA